MTFRLDRLEASQPLVEGGAGPSISFQVLWQRLVEAIEAQEDAQDAIIARIRRIGSHTVPTTILTAEDDGTTATITVAAHVRAYADGTTLSVAGGSESGLTSDTNYAVYYVDSTLADTAPDYLFTTDIEAAQAAAADGNHFCGIIRTPDAGSGETRTGGGAYPASSSIGGEVDP